MGDQRGCVWPGTTGHAWGPDPLPGAWGPFCLHKINPMVRRNEPGGNPLGPKVPVHSQAGFSQHPVLPRQTGDPRTLRGGLSGCVQGPGPNVEEMNYESPRECGRNTAEVRVFSGLEAALLLTVLVERQDRGREESRGERQKEGETGRAERDGGQRGRAGEEEPRSWGRAVGAARENEPFCPAKGTRVIAQSPLFRSPVPSPSHAPFHKAPAAVP